MQKKGDSEVFKPKHLDLLAACKRGDQKAQFEIYRLYHPAMYNTSLRILGDVDDAEDVMQEAFLKAFLKLDSYRGEVSFGAWLKRIVVNKSLDFLRLKKEHLSLEELNREAESAQDEIKTEEDWTPYPGLGIEQIKEAIFQLADGYRIVLSLILLEGYDHDEVAQILNISNATSRTQYHRAKKKLISLLRDKEQDKD